MKDSSNPGYLSFRDRTEVIGINLLTDDRLALIHDEEGPTHAGDGFRQGYRCPTMEQPQGLMGSGIDGHGSDHPSRGQLGDFHPEGLGQGILKGLTARCQVELCHE